MSTEQFQGDTIRRLGSILGDMMEAQRTFALEAVNLLGSGITELGSGSLGKLTDRLTSSCCDIPPPCWMPRSLGEIDCRLCPGSTATLRVRVTNEDIRSRTFVGMASGAAAAHVSFNPGNLTLGPKERGVMTAVFTVPAQAAEEQSLESIVWVRGCSDYYLRWTVVAGARSRPCCHEVCIEDGPDYILHWYDHFYCPRGCFGGGQAS